MQTLLSTNFVDHEKQHVVDQVTGRLWREADPRLEALLFYD